MEDNVIPFPGIDPAAVQPVNQEPAIPEPIDGLLDGRVPAVRVPSSVRGPSGDPAIGFLQENFGALVNGGAVDFVELEDGGTVLFNPSVLDQKTVQQAIEAGTIGELTVTLGDGLSGTS